MSSDRTNPLLGAWTTPFAVPPFTAIEAAHFREAFEAGMAEHDADIDAIVADTRPADFDTVIAPLERMGALLRRVNGVFWNLASADTNDELQAIERDISPALARHYQAISTNADLFRRVEAVWNARDELPLDDEQQRVLELTYKGFVRDGAQLPPDKKERLGAIVERLATLGTQFSQNVLADEKSYVLPIQADDLAGLPAAVVDATAQAAAERGLEGHAVTLSRSIVVPFLQYADRRDLREKVFAAWIKRGENGGATDNAAIVAETVRLRAERARLLGSECFADYKLEPTMAHTPEAVRELLDTVWAKAVVRAGEEEADLQDCDSRGGWQFPCGSA